jgi:hypothetical protein
MARLGTDVRIPPLTVDLFDESKYGEVLRKYDLAHQAGRFIEEERAQDNALGLEAALHRLSTSSYTHHRHMALAVPPYLRHFLLAVGEQLYPDALHYDRLIERLLRLPYVFFVSLNYDLILDRRLSAHRHLSDLYAYIRGDNWSLIKPHGSVAWSHTTSEAFIPERPPADLQWDHVSFECLPPESKPSELLGLRFTDSRLTDRYPALAAPEGPDDRLVLPSAHSEFFGQALYAAREIDILVVGYSGLDHEILRFIRGADPKIRYMTIVSSTLAEAEEVGERFRDSGLEPVWYEPVSGNFASWSNSGGPNRLIEEYGGPYSRAR